MLDFVLMASQRIALRLPSDLYQLLASHINDTGVFLSDLKASLIILGQPVTERKLLKF